MILSPYAFALAIGAQSGRRRGAASQAWIPLGERSGLLTRIATMESILLCARMSSCTRL